MFSISNLTHFNLYKYQRPAAAADDYNYTAGDLTNVHIARGLKPTEYSIRSF